MYYCVTFCRNLFLVKEGNSNYQLLSDCFNIVYRSLLLLGCNMAPETTRKRIVFLTALTMGMVLYWLWEAMLISYFSAAKLTLPFNNLEELLIQSDSKVLKRLTILFNKHNKFGNMNDASLIHMNFILARSC